MTMPLLQARRNMNLVSWNDAAEYCRRVGKRLPTEAEWEYACRAGSTTEFYWGDTIDGQYVWYKKNDGGKTHPVGQKKPNAWGLYDMVGNVWEWCNDWYGSYKTGAQTNPQGARSSWYRILRGGASNNDDYANELRSTHRNYCDIQFIIENTGFRCVR